MKKIFDIFKSDKKLIVGGIVGVAAVVAGAILHTKALNKAEQIKKEHEDAVKEFEEVLELYPDEYSEEDLQSDTMISQSIKTLKMIRNYAFAVVLEAVGAYIVYNVSSVVAFKYYRRGEDLVCQTV